MAGLFHKIKSLFSSTEDAESALPAEDKADFTSKKIHTKIIQPEVEKPKAFLKYQENRAVPENLDIQFAKNMNERSGNFFYCESNAELVKNLESFFIQNKLTQVFCWEDYLRSWLEKNGFNKLLFQSNIEEAQLGLSLCEGLISNEGSVMLSADQATRRTLTVFPNLHIIIAHKKQLKIDIDHAMEEYKFRYDDALPFLLQLGNEIPKYRNVNNKLIINAEGTKNVFVFYSEEPIEFV